MSIRSESELYEPLRKYLEGQGYSVHAEVGACDLVARKAGAADEEDELIAVELKLRLSLDLMVQAVKRKELTEAVYVAVPLEGSRARVRNLQGIKSLLKRVEVGLIAVRFLSSKTRIEVLYHPRPHQPRIRYRRRIAVLREIDGRYVEFDRAGQPSTRERITAYKQQSLLLAQLLAEQKRGTPRELRRISGIDRTGNVLLANLYGWFYRVRRGLYELSSSGHEALEHYREIGQEIREEHRRRGLD